MGRLAAVGLRQSSSGPVGSAGRLRRGPGPARRRRGRGDARRGPRSAGPGRDGRGRFAGGNWGITITENVDREGAGPGRAPSWCRLGSVRWVASLTLQILPQPRWALSGRGGSARLGVGSRGILITRLAAEPPTLRLRPASLFIETTSGDDSRWALPPRSVFVEGSEAETESDLTIEMARRAPLGADSRRQPPVRRSDVCRPAASGLSSANRS